MKFEQPRQHPLRTTGLVITLGLASFALASCSQESSGTTDHDTPSATSTAGQSIKQAYLADGTRLTTYPDGGGAFADVLAYCDGPDLVEQTSRFGEGYLYGGSSGNSIDRSIDHPACTDGRLTASDFEKK